MAARVIAAIAGGSWTSNNQEIYATSCRESRTAEVHVSEPARTGREFEVTWHRPVRKALSADGGVEVLEASKSLRLRVTPGTSGATPACEVLLRRVATATGGIPQQWPYVFAARRTTGESPVCAVETQQPSARSMGDIAA
jgi:hypothetical protein